MIKDNSRMYDLNGKCFVDKKPCSDLTGKCLDCPRTIAIRDLHAYLTQTQKLPEAYTQQHGTAAQ